MPMTSLTEAQLNEMLFGNGKPETSKETVKRWVDARNFLNKWNIKLTEKQQEQFDFICFKLDDWASDYDPPE